MAQPSGDRWRFLGNGEFHVASDDPCLPPKIVGTWACNGFCGGIVNDSVEEGQGPPESHSDTLSLFLQDGQPPQFYVNHVKEGRESWIWGRKIADSQPAHEAWLSLSPHEFIDKLVKSLLSCSGFAIPEFEFGTFADRSHMPNEWGEVAERGYRFSQGTVEDWIPSSSFDVVGPKQVLVRHLSKPMMTLTFNTPDCCYGTDAYGNPVSGVRIGPARPQQAAHLTKSLPGSIWQVPTTNQLYARTQRRLRFDPPNAIYELAEDGSIGHAPSYLWQPIGMTRFFSPTSNVTFSGP